MNMSMSFIYFNHISNPIIILLLEYFLLWSLLVHLFASRLRNPRPPFHKIPALLTFSSVMLLLNLKGFARIIILAFKRHRKMMASLFSPGEVRFVHEAVHPLPFPGLDVAVGACDDDFMAHFDGGVHARELD